jgi:hypothetical protein
MQGLFPRLTVASALLACASLFTACYPKSADAPGAISPTSVSWASEKWPGVTEASLVSGREAFLAKCNGCHGYPDLAAISDDEWPSIVERMGGKSDLDAAKTKDVLHYVLAAKH